MRIVVDDGTEMQANQFVPIDYFDEYNVRQMPTNLSVRTKLLVVRFRFLIFYSINLPYFRMH